MEPLPPVDDLARADPLLQTVIPDEFRTIQSREAEPVPEGTTYAKIAQVVGELARRKAEALALYEPLPNQVEFHQSRAPERLLRGSIRAGKTLPSAIEIARAVCGRDPYGKYPLRDGRVYQVSPDEQHIADVVWKKLGHAGAFKIIRDLDTKLWRSYRPWHEEDVAREKESKPAPPLIPPRIIADIAWSDKKRGVPKTVKLKTGWEINFFSANGEPQRGVDLDVVWF